MPSPPLAKEAWADMHSEPDFELDFGGEEPAGASGGQEQPRMDSALAEVKKEEEVKGSALAEAPPLPPAPPPASVPNSQWVADGRDASWLPMQEPAPAESPKESAGQGSALAGPR